MRAANAPLPSQSPPDPFLRGWGRGGWAILEFIVAALLLFLLTGLALPQVERSRNRAIAAQVLEDVSDLRDAAAIYMAAQGEWPPEAGEGRPSGEISRYLPGNFSFRGDGYEVAWERWDLPDGLPPHGGPMVLAGVSVRSEIPGLERSLRRMLGEDVPTVSDGFTHTFIFEGL